MTSNALRLVLLVEGSLGGFEPCRVVCASTRGSLSEVWLTCGSPASLIEALSSLLKSGGVLLAVGGLGGRVSRFLPSSLDVLVDMALSDIVLEPGSRVVLDYCVAGAKSLVKELVVHASTISFRPRERRVYAVLSKKLGASWFFDRGVRVVKPIVSPPVLLGAVAARGRGAGASGGGR